MKRLFILMALTVLGLFVSLGATTVNVGAFTGMDLSLPNSTHDQINSQREASRNDYPYAPAYTNAQVNDSGSGVFIYWPSPNPDIREVRSSFEEPNFPPPGWFIINNDDGLPYPDVYPTWKRVGVVDAGDHNIVPPDDLYQVGISSNDDFYPLDEWLITPLFYCPYGTDMSFASSAQVGSSDDIKLFVKASSNGGASWTVVWDAAYNQDGVGFFTCYGLDMSGFWETQVRLAFHVSNISENQGASYMWHIDDVRRYDGPTPPLYPDDLSTIPMETSSRLEADKSRIYPTGYKVYRIRVGQEQYFYNWVSLSQCALGNSFTDSAWESLPDGDYRWAVMTVYSSGLTSMPVLSNVINKGMPMGTIKGRVTNESQLPVADAAVSCGTTSTTTDRLGFYQLDVPAGYDTVSFSAVGYETVVESDIRVYRNRTATVNVVLPKVVSGDDPQNPVPATALGGNYPNPFNPVTTISYSVKEAGRVKLEIYNIKGQKVRSLVDENHAAGHYKQVFDARDNRGRSLSSGVYLIRMIAPGYQKVSKMMLMQ